MSEAMGAKSFSPDWPSPPNARVECRPEFVIRCGARVVRKVSGAHHRLGSGSRRPCLDMGVP